MDTLCNTEITIATNIFCPHCGRLVCKRREINDVMYVEWKHKKAFMIAKDCLIQCSCGKYTIFVDGNDGIVKEMTIGEL